MADPQLDLAWSPTTSSAGGAEMRFMVHPDDSFPRLASRSKEVAKWHNVHDLALTPTGSRAIHSDVDGNPEEESLGSEDGPQPQAGGTRLLRYYVCELWFITWAVKVTTLEPLRQSRHPPLGASH